MYRLTCILAALLCACLFPLLLVNSGAYVQTYGIAPDPGVAFLGRRAAPMFLGLAVLLWIARDIDPGPARSAICIAMGFTWAGVAATGLYEFSVGTAHYTIVLAAAFELALAAAFLIARNR